MQVSIIIVNYNGKKFLEDCLSSLYSITYDDYEVILVDNHSSDGSVDFVRKNFPNVVIKQLEQNFGFAKPNNIGADIAKNELLLFLNNDTKVTEGFLEPLVAEMKSNEIAICQSLLLKPDGAVDSAGDFVDKYGRAFSSKKVPNDTSPILSARGACMLIKKEIFWKLDGFDEKFFVSFEDVDLSWRAWILGYKVVIVPPSVVFHYSGKTISKLKEEIQFHGYKNSLVLVLTNFDCYDSFKSLLFLSIDVIFRRLFGVSVKHSEKSLVPSFKIILKAVVWVIQNRSYILDKKNVLKEKRKLTTSDLTKLGLITKTHQL